MYHTPVGPVVATGLGTGGGLFAFSMFGMVWALLAAFAIVGASTALLRVAPASLTERPLALFRPGRHAAPRA